MVELAAPRDVTATAGNIPADKITQKTINPFITPIVENFPILDKHKIKPTMRPIQILWSGRKQVGKTSVAQSRRYGFPAGTSVPREIAAGGSTLIFI